MFILVHLHSVCQYTAFISCSFTLSCTSIRWLSLFIYTQLYQYNVFILVHLHSVVPMQILDRISLQYAPNANERKTQTKRTKNKRMLHTNDTKNARYTKRTNARDTKRTHDTWTNEQTKWNERTIRKTQTNKRTIHETNERYTKRTHDTRTNESLEPL